MAAGCVQNQMFSCQVKHSDCFCSKLYHYLGALAGAWPQAKAVRIMIFMPLCMSICGCLTDKIL